MRREYLPSEVRSRFADPLRRMRDHLPQRFFLFWSAAQKERKGMSVLQKTVPTEKPRYRRCCEIYVKAEAEKENIHTA